MRGDGSRSSSQSCEPPKWPIDGNSVILGDWSNRKMMRVTWGTKPKRWWVQTPAKSMAMEVAWVASFQASIVGALAVFPAVMTAGMWWLTSKLPCGSCLAGEVAENGRSSWVGLQVRVGLDPGLLSLSLSPSRYLFIETSSNPYFFKLNTN